MRCGNTDSLIIQSKKKNASPALFRCLNKQNRLLWVHFFARFIMITSNAFEITIAHYWLLFFQCIACPQCVLCFYLFQLLILNLFSFQYCKRIGKKQQQQQQQQHRDEQCHRYIDVEISIVHLFVRTFRCLCGTVFVVVVVVDSVGFYHSVFASLCLCIQCNLIPIL